MSIAVGRLVIVARMDRGGTTLCRMAALTRWPHCWRQGTGFRRLCHRNPDHAPYGISRTRGLEAARRMGGPLQTVSGYGEKRERKPAQFPCRQLPRGLTAYSLMLSADIAPRGTYGLIPETAHAPLRQRHGSAAAASQTAVAFSRLHARVKQGAGILQTTALPCRRTVERWIATHLWLSLQLAGWTVVILLPDRRS